MGGFSTTVLLAWLIGGSAVFGYVDDYSYSIFSAYAQTLEANFGMVRNAELKIKSTISDPGNVTYVLFVVVDRNSYLGWYESVSSGAISGTDANSYCNKPSTFRIHAHASAEYVLNVPDTDRYSVILLQCHDVSLHMPVYVDVRLTMSNPAPRGSDVSYMTIERLPMIPILQIQIGLIIIMLVGFVTALASRPLLVKGVHYVFVLVLSLGFVVVALETHGVVNVSATGDRNRSLGAEISLFQAFQITAFYGCSLLLSFGFSVYRPNLPPSEIKFIVGIMTLSLAFAVIKASCNWVLSELCSTVDIYLFLIRGIIVISTLLGTNYTVSRLRNSIQSSPWSPSVPMQYYLLQKYTSWRNVYIIYIISPTIFAIIEVTMLSWKSRWIVSMMDDFLVIFVYMSYGILFQPFDQSEVLRGFDGSMREVIE